MRFSLIGWSVLSLLGVTAPATPSPEDYTFVEQVSDLPEPVRALLNDPMSDPGQPFQRLIWAAKLKDGRYVIHHEHAGGGRSPLTAVITTRSGEGFELTGRGWPGVHFPSVEAFLDLDEAFGEAP